MTPEGKIKAEIKKYLDSIGAYHAWPVPTGYGSSLLDCYGCIHGTFFAIEVKRPGGKATPRQLVVVNKIMAAEGLVIVAESVDHVRNMLKNHVVRTFK